MASDSATAIGPRGEPSAAMRAAMKVEEELRAPYPEPKNLPEERELRAKICSYWLDGAPEREGLRRPAGLPAAEEGALLGGFSGCGGRSCAALRDSGFAPSSGRGPIELVPTTWGSE